MEYTSARKNPTIDEFLNKASYYITSMIPGIEIRKEELAKRIDDKTLEKYIKEEDIGGIVKHTSEAIIGVLQEKGFYPPKIDLKDVKELYSTYNLEDVLKYYSRGLVRGAATVSAAFA
ncbi:MAG: hypothetical protein ACP5G1_04235, partial [Nanopusillaceae archaeon]